MAEWDRYLGEHVSPAQYKVQGGNRETIVHDLRELWGDHPTDQMDEDEIQRVADELAQELEKV